jgi:N-acetylneuraminic acid mutarotase
MTYPGFLRAPRLKMLLFSISTLCLICCDSDDDDDYDGNWSKLATPSTSIRAGAVSFVLNGEGYFGLGYNGSPSGSSTARGYKTDFWSYNGAVWEEDIPAFPGTPREQAVAFTLDNKVYVGLGYNDDLEETLSDFWEYDPARGTWESIGAFPIALMNAVAFVVDGRAFVGTGRKSDDNWENRFWEFDASSRSWPASPYTTIPSDLREGAFAFVINSTVYIGGGFNNSTYLRDMYLFTPSSEAAMQSYPLNNDDDSDYYDEFAAAVGRGNTVVFVNNGLAFFATGGSPSALSSVYQYNPASEVWEQKTAFEGAARTHAVGFVFNNRMILGTGNNGTSYFNDFWEFKPNDEYDELK